MGVINCLRSAAHNVFPVVFEENISLISRSIFNRFEVARNKFAAFRKNRSTVLIWLFTENIYPKCQTFQGNSYYLHRLSQLLPLRR